jgi:hypothetical protein
VSNSSDWSNNQRSNNQRSNNQRSNNQRSRGFLELESEAKTQAALVFTRVHARARLPSLAESLVGVLTVLNLLDKLAAKSESALSLLELIDRVSEAAILVIALLLLSD